mmetsp:Transcript_48929/g.106517  ORF Transcript_48929/g.106517 Transcript_48929/m.106517 type:complete len:205 (+) Transcript_48929:285-899(+)
MEASCSTRRTGCSDTITCRRNARIRRHISEYIARRKSPCSKQATTCCIVSHTFLSMRQLTTSHCNRNTASKTLLRRQIPALVCARHRKVMSLPAGSSKLLLNAAQPMPSLTEVPTTSTTFSPAQASVLARSRGSPLENSTLGGCSRCSTCGGSQLPDVHLLHTSCTGLENWASSNPTTLALRWGTFSNASSILYLSNALYAGCS